MNQSWQIEEGLKLIRALQGRVKEFGYHIALGGGVLNNGASDKDLDLYFLPFNNPNVAKEDTTGMLEWLSKLWGEPRTIGEYPENQGAPTGGMRRIVAVAPSVTRTRQWVSSTPVTPTFVNEDEPMSAPPAQEVDTYWSGNPIPKKKVESRYKYKLKFERAGNDRIDVFIL